MTKKLLIGIFLFGLSILAQPDFQISGYALNMTIYQPATDLKIVKLDDQYFNLTRLRIKPSLNFGYNARIDLHYEINSLYMNKSSFGIFDLNSVSNRRQIVDLNWNVINNNNLITNHYIDRLSVRHEMNWGNVEIGRQRISGGTGRIWNPTDLFNPINPANFTKIEKDGADAISTMIYLGNFTDLNIVYNPTDDFNQSNYGFRFRTNYAQYDFSFVSGYFDKRIVAGLDFAGNLFDAGIRGEVIFSIANEDDKENFLKFILGADYQFSSELYAVVEYQFNGEGKTQKTDYELTRLTSGEILNLSRNYLHTGLSCQITPLLNFSLNNTFNFNDKSGFLGFSAYYSITSDLYILAGTQISYGNEFTEYWFFPDTYFLQGEFYF